MWGKVEPQASSVGSSPQWGQGRPICLKLITSVCLSLHRKFCHQCRFSRSTFSYQVPMAGLSSASWKRRWTSCHWIPMVSSTP